MGRRIDRWTLTALGATALYLFFLNVWGSIPLACAAAFAASVLARRFLREHPPKRRVTGRQIAARLLRLASLPEAQAQAELVELISRGYPGEDFQLAVALKHPEAALSSGDILGAWKANRGADRLVVAATCLCEPRAALYARQLRGPAVAIVDSRALARLMRRSGGGNEAQQAQQARPGQWLMRFAGARISPRSALLAAGMLAMYLRFGSALYLLSSLVTLFGIGAALLQRRTGKRLFDGA